MHTKRYAHIPPLLIERILSSTPKEKQEDVLESFFLERPTTFRRNALATTHSDLLEELRKENVTAQAVPWLPDAFIQPSDSPVSILKTKLYSEGKIYVQSLSSMIPTIVLDPQPDERILDIAAAPGSKTTQIASLMNNTGEIVANDNSRIRLYKLEANLKIQHATRVRVLNKQAQELWQLYPEYFDRTLVDVPCSMEGRMDFRDEKTYKDWSPKKIKILAERQKWMLRSAVSATKPGGVIVYSTCTLAPEENEAIIDWLLKKEKGNVVLESITLDIPDAIAGIIGWNGKLFDQSLSLTKRILPSHTMEGFYVAKLRKVNSTIPSSLRSS